MNKPTPDLRSAGETALAEAVRIFERDIWDPPVSDRRPVADRWRAEITRLIAGPDGLGWSWEGDYTGDGDYEWCGAFAASCWAVAGLPLATRRRFWASTYRLHRWGHYRSIDQRVEPPRPTVGPWRVAGDLRRGILPEGLEPRPGDVLLVGPRDSSLGSHVTLVERYDPAQEMFLTLEGNARGIGPDGKNRQGVVRAARPLRRERWSTDNSYTAAWLIRPAPSDLSPLAVA